MYVTEWKEQLRKRIDGQEEYDNMVEFIEEVLDAHHRYLRAEN